MSIPVHFKCRQCDFVFGVVINEDQLGHIPCPGCAGKDLEQIEAATDYYLLSREAEDCTGDCACCKANCANREPDTGK